MGQLAILAASGALPVKLAQAHPQALIFGLKGVERAPSLKAIEHRFDQLGGLFDDLKAKGVDQIVFAGGMSRPQLDPTAFDPFMMALAPKLAAAFQQGDDALLRFIIAIFEDQGIKVVGAHDLLPALTASAGLIAGEMPQDPEQADIKVATSFLQHMAPLDVGQGVVVASGLCLGIETLQGTDALLGFVAQTPDHLRRSKGVFVKAPKAGQDLRVDMPAIGPQTIENVAKAGLSGLVIAAEKVLLLDRSAIEKAVEKHGLFLLAQDDL